MAEEKDSFEKLQDAIALLTNEVSTPKDQRDEGKLTTATGKVTTASASALLEWQALNAKVEKFNGLIKDVNDIATKATVKNRYRWPTALELGFDALRVIVPAAIALCAVWFGSPPLAKLAIGLSIVWIAAILMAAAIRSDQIYALHGGGLGHVLYNLMPSRLFAPLFVAGLFVAIWLGFATLYKAAVTGMTAHTALQDSFVILATFNPPEAASPFYDLALWQLGSAVLLVICVFSMLINRISEF